MHNLLPVLFLVDLSYDPRTVSGLGRLAALAIVILLLVVDYI